MATDTLKKVNKNEVAGMDCVIPPDLFPLPLTTFEQYMLTDDRPDYPMGFVIEITLSGPLEREVFEAAIDQATRRHPLLVAIVAKSSRRLSWENSHQKPTVYWEENLNDREPLSIEHLDLRSKPGLETTVHDEGTQSRVSFLFHHAVVDGVGAMHFIGDLLAIYGQCTSGSNDQWPELSEVEPSLLLQRGQLHANNSPLNHSWLRTFRHLYEFLRYYPSGIASRRSSRKSSKAEPRQPFLTRILNRGELTTIKNEAIRLNVTPNDIYVANLFQAIKTWNSLQGRVCSKECYRVGIPASLRTPVHDHSPAANIVSYIFLNQPGKTIENRKDLIHDIHQRTTQILSSTDSRLTLHCLKVGLWVPGLLSLVMNLPLRLSTATLANVGDVKRQLNCRFPMKKGKCVAGSVTLEGLFGAAPIRKGTAVGISVGSYAGQLLMNFNCDPRCFSIEEAEQFADLFVSLLLNNNRNKIDD